MGKIKAQVDALDAKLKAQGDKFGWVDHELGKYRIARGAIRDNGKPIHGHTMEEAKAKLDELIKERDAGNRKTVQPEHLKLLKHLTAYHVDPILTAAIMQEDLADAASISTSDGDDPKKAGQKAKA